jgi:hypothetical protein
MEVCVVSLKNCPSLLLNVNICACKQGAQLRMTAVILFLILIAIAIRAVAALGHESYTLERAIKSNSTSHFPCRYFQLPETPIIKTVPEYPPPPPESYPSNHQPQTNSLHHHPPWANVHYINPLPPSVKASIPRYELPVFPGPNQKNPKRLVIHHLPAIQPQPINLHFQRFVLVYETKALICILSSQKRCGKGVFRTLKEKVMFL